MPPDSHVTIVVMSPISSGSISSEIVGGIGKIASFGINLQLLVGGVPEIGTAGRNLH